VNTEDVREFFAEYDQRGIAVASIVQANGAVVSLEDVRGVWYRRPESPSLRRDIEPSTRKYVVEQWQDAIEGLEALPWARWMSRPSAIRRAENKMLQLSWASQHGFVIPHTTITNSPSRLQRLRATGERLVSKTLGSALIHDSAGDRFTYAFELSDANAPAPAELEACPVVFQTLIQPARHLRVTVVGEGVFCAEVVPRSAAVIDWRAASDPPEVRRFTLPAEADRRCIDLVQEAGLSFASMDLLHAEDRFYFLDLNPNGEWAWIARPTGYPIAEAIVDYLATE